MGTVDLSEIEAMLTKLASRREVTALLITIRAHFWYCQSDAERIVLLASALEAYEGSLIKNIEIAIKALQNKSPEPVVLAQVQPFRVEDGQVDFSSGNAMICAGDRAPNKTIVRFGVVEATGEPAIRYGPCPVREARAVMYGDLYYGE